MFIHLCMSVGGYVCGWVCVCVWVWVDGCTNSTTWNSLRQEIDDGYDGVVESERRRERRREGTGEIEKRR